ncbi:VG15 protein [Streptomyces roseolus]|uniref:VG15 protein n=1 Tax=Streptomyces roseolus TaxID=67358 RepID=UPI0036CBF4CA
MPSPEATRLTLEFQRQVQRAAELIARRLRVTAMRADVTDIDGWWERISPQVQEEILTGQSALARLARGYLQQHAALEGVRLAPVVVQPNPEQIATSLRVTGPVAFKTHMAASGGEEAASVRIMSSQLQGSAQRLLLDGPRETTMRTFAERDEMVGWRRVRGGGDTCPFCTMLIGRGAVYSKQSAKFQTHDRCACSAEPLYRREPEPPEVQKLARQWREATAGTTGAASVRAWQAYSRGQAAQAAT